MVPTFVQAFWYVEDRQTIGQLLGALPKGMEEIHFLGPGYVDARGASQNCSCKAVL